MMFVFDGGKYRLPLHMMFVDGLRLCLVDVCRLLAEVCARSIMFDAGD